MMCDVVKLSEVPDILPHSERVMKPSRVDSICSVVSSTDRQLRTSEGPLSRTPRKYCTAILRRNFFIPRSRGLCHGDVLSLPRQDGSWMAMLSWERLRNSERPRLTVPQAREL